MNLKKDKCIYFFHITTTWMVKYSKHTHTHTHNIIKAHDTVAQHLFGRVIVNSLSGGVDVELTFSQRDSDSDCVV